MTYTDDLIVKEDLTVRGKIDSEQKVSVNTKSTIITISSALQLNGNNGTLVRLRSINQIQEISLPVSPTVSQLLYVSLIGGSPYGIIVKSTTTNMPMDYYVDPGTTMSFIYEGNVWNLVSTYKEPVSDLVNIYLHMGA